MNLKPISEEQMVKILAEKLTQEEFFQLFLLIDGDGQAGPFWGIVADKAKEFFPVQFDCVYIDTQEKINETLKSVNQALIPHWINPWEDAIPVPIEELAECHEGLDKFYGTMDPGVKILMTKERILAGWKQDGDKLDAYILPQSNGWNCIGVRYGNEGSEYLSPMANQEKTRALLKKYSSDNKYNFPDKG